MADIAKRFAANPILKPSDIPPSAPGMKVECLLNPGVFRFQNRTWLLLRVAERPEQTAGKTTFPIIAEDGTLRILQFDNADPRLDLSDPRVLRYDGVDYFDNIVASAVGGERRWGAFYGRRFSWADDGAGRVGELWD